jgi:carboxylesterase type B
MEREMLYGWAHENMRTAERAAEQASELADELGYPEAAARLRNAAEDLVAIRMTFPLSD